eukprot:1160208-Pelagomonas_calceolata.AAC.8
MGLEPGYSASMLVICSFQSAKGFFNTEAETNMVPIGVHPTHCWLRGWLVSFHTGAGVWARRLHHTYYAMMA